MLVDLRDYDSAKPLEYLHLVEILAGAFREITSHSDLMSRLGEDSLTDITNIPVVQLMEEAFALPPEFNQRVYQFRDDTFGRGVFDAAFYEAEIVNMRAQLFFRGWFANSNACRYLHEDLVPLFQRILGEPSDQIPEHSVFRSNGIVGVTRLVPESTSVSSTLTDERFTSGGA
jgi:hypothetical protein